MDDHEMLHPVEFGKRRRKKEREESGERSSHMILLNSSNKHFWFPQTDRGELYRAVIRSHQKATLTFVQTCDT